VTFIGAHDSAFVSTTEEVAANQHFDVTRQLNDGIRLLQSQGHKPTGTVAGGIELCHTTCTLYVLVEIIVTVDSMAARYSPTCRK
jgi:hypothetical protein